MSTSAMIYSRRRFSSPTHSSSSQTINSSNTITLTDGARLTYREVLGAREQRPSVREELQPVIYQASRPDGRPQNETGLTDRPQVYLHRRDDPLQAYALLPDRTISLSHHHPEWGDVYFAVICPRKGNTFAHPPKRSAEYVAIKRLKKSAVHECLSLGMNENPYREIARLQELGDNIHVLKLIEALEDDEYLYIVTPRGIGTLADTIPWHSRELLDPKRVRQIFQQLLQILLYLESHNIVHRDMSPDNFLFLTPDDLVVFDFGFSLRVPVDESTGRRYLMANEGNFGTPPYMCPELYVNAPYDSLSSDLWSVTVILLNLLTNGWLCDRPHHVDICFRYFVLAQGLSSSRQSNARAEEVLRSVIGPGTVGSPRNLLWQIQALQFLDDAAIEVVANVLHINPAVRWSLAQVIQSDFVNNEEHNNG